MAGGDLANAPQYIDEVEALLGSSFFYDLPRQNALYEDFSALDDSELGARRSAYIGALAVLAQARADERSMEHPSRIGEWNEKWQLTLSRIAGIAMQYEPRVRTISRWLAMLNNFEKAMADGYARDGLLDYQSPYLAGILAGLQQGPQTVILPEWWPGGEVYSLPGVIVHGPTGIGKSALAARTVVSLGIGTVPKGEERYAEPQPLRALIVEPSQALIRAMTGKVGRGIFRELAPGMRIGSHYAYERADPGQHVIFTTVDMFVAQFRDGALAGIPIDFLGIDEVHHLTEPLFLQTLLRHWGGPTVGFSATPAYDEAKDARNILRYEVHKGGVMDYVDKGVLSDMSIYSLVVYPSDIGLKAELSEYSPAERRQFRWAAEAKFARDFVLPLVAEGRKGVIFCEPGYNSQHAREVAALLCATQLPDGRHIKARAVGTFQGNSESAGNTELFDQFDKGHLDVLTSVQMGQEGLHLNEVNFVVVICKCTSALKLYQMAGRGLGLSERFGDVILANINTVGFGREQYYAQTFAEIYGGDTIEQGRVVKRNRTRLSGMAAAANLELPIPKGPDFPPNIQRMLDRIDGKTISEAYLSRGDEAVEIPDHYIALSAIIDGLGILPRNALFRLRRTGYRFKGRLERGQDGKLEYVRYYEPAAKTYFTDRPEPPQDGVKLRNLTGYQDPSNVMTLEEMAAMLRMNPKVLMRRHLTEAEAAASSIMRVGSKARCRSWKRSDGERIAERVKQSLLCPAHVVPLGVAAARFNAKYNTVRELTARLKDQLGVKQLKLGGRTLPGLPWHTIQKLEERYGLREGLPPIDYDKLPKGPEATSEQIAYARLVQRQMGMNPAWLPD